MKISLSLLALASLLAGGSSTASAPAATSAPAVKLTTHTVAAAGPATMAALAQQFRDALQQQDAAKATALLAKNARFVANMNAMSGRDSLSTYWLKRSFSATNNLKITETSSGGDAMAGYTAGFYSADMKTTANYPNGGSVRGSYMIFSRKEGANWLISYVHLAEEPVKAK